MDKLNAVLSTYFLSSLTKPSHHLRQLLKARLICDQRKALVLCRGALNAFQFWRGAGSMVPKLCQRLNCTFGIETCPL